MIDVVSILLLIAADPESPTIRVIRVDPDSDLAKETKKSEAAETAVQHAPYPVIEDPMMGLSSGDYPADSLRNGEEGNVRIALEVDTEGKPTRCTVVQSSGHPALDQRTCQVGMERARFRPAHDQQGKPVDSVWRSPPVRWQAPKADYTSLPRIESYHATTIQIGADGTIGECTVEQSGTIMIPDSCEQAKSRHAQNAKEAARWWKSLTSVIVTSNKDVPPSFSKPEWGLRQSRMVTAQLQINGRPSPVSCETIITEGWAFGGTGCPPPDLLASPPVDANWSKARTLYTEFSSFGQPR
jgi:TonB family protein